MNVWFESLKTLYRIDTPIKGLYRRIVHLINMGEIPEQDGHELMAIVERLLKAKGVDPDNAL